MVFLPRLARALNKPGIATVLPGLVLVAVAIIGMTSGDIRTLWAIIILVVGAINLLASDPHPRRELRTYCFGVWLLHKRRARPLGRF